MAAYPSNSTPRLFSTFEVSSRSFCILFLGTLSLISGVEGQVSISDPWVGQFSSLGSSSLAIINGALTEAASGDATRAGASVFNFVDSSVAALYSNVTGTSSLTTLSTFLEGVTLSMQQIVQLVSNPYGESVSNDTLSVVYQLQLIHTFVANTYLEWAKYTSFSGLDTPSDSDLLSVLDQSPSEVSLADAVSSLLIQGPSAVPVGFLAIAEHLALLQERYFRGQNAYRHVVRRYAARYFRDLTDTGSVTVGFVSAFFDKARQNYPSNNFTMLLDGYNGSLVYVNTEGQVALEVLVSRAVLAQVIGADEWARCGQAVGNASCGLVTNTTLFSYFTFALLVKPAFAGAISSLDDLRGFGNIDQSVSSCLGCTIGLRAALSANLAVKGVARASSGVSASLAVDRNYNNILVSETCFSTAPNGSANPSWVVDLGASQVVTSVHLFTPPVCCTDLINGVEVFVGEDATAYSANQACGFVAQRFWDVATAYGGPFSLLCGGLSGRYVWVALPGPSRVLQLCNVIVLGNDTAPAVSTRGAIANPTSTVSSCLTIVSPGGQCGAQANLCCPATTPCCGSGGLCGSTNSSCIAGCDPLFSYNGVCHLA